MDYYKNFKPRCEIEEAVKLSEKLTLDIMRMIWDCYYNAYRDQMKSIKDVRWAQNCALNSVYMLGFISGCRAIKERKKPIADNSQQK